MSIVSALNVAVNDSDGPTGLTGGAPGRILDPTILFDGSHLAAMQTAVVVIRALQREPTMKLNSLLMLLAVPLLLGCPGDQHVGSGDAGSDASVTTDVAVMPDVAVTPDSSHLPFSSVKARAATVSPEAIPGR